MYLHVRMIGGTLFFYWLVKNSRKSFHLAPVIDLCLIHFVFQRLQL
jgi:hypothetical protein